MECSKQYLILASSLLENTQMPSVSGFAECQTTGTRQRCGTRHAKTLPSAGRRQRKALGIARLCRVPAGEHSAKTAHVPSTRVRRATAVRVADGRQLLPSAARPALGKNKISPSVCRRHSAKPVSPSAIHMALGKQFLFLLFFQSNFFIINSNLKS